MLALITCAACAWNSPKTIYPLCFFLDSPHQVKKKKWFILSLILCFLSLSSLISTINFVVIIKMILLGIINKQRIIPLYISPLFMCIFLCRHKCSSFSTLYNKLLYICKTLSLILVKWPLRWAGKIEQILKLHLFARICV